MTDEPCDCDDASVRRTDGRGATDRWLDERPVLEAPLPPGMAREMTGFYGEGPVETLGDFVAATRAGVGGGLAVEDLCHAGGETPHRATVAGERYRFQCFYDGVALSHLVDEPAEVRTESPAGEPVTVRVDPDGGVETTPAGTVMSFGIATDVAADGDDPTVEDVYDAVCPYVKAFPERGRYEAWAAGVDAATVGLPVAEGMPVAAALTDDA